MNLRFVGLVKMCACWGSGWWAEGAQVRCGSGGVRGRGEGGQQACASCNGAVVRFSSDRLQRASVASALPHVN